MVVTFYSFKGGVGRSMAMVNVAEILAARGYRVIVADWDLEAPGLERYLLSRDTMDAAEYQRLLDVFLTRDGIIDLLREYKASLTRPARAESETADDFAQLGKLLVRRPSSITIPIPGEGRPDEALRLLTAGRRDGESQEKYGETVRSFDWDEFYDRWAGDAYVDFFRRDLAGDPASGVTGAADLLLVDSRTGVTEQGGVCTHDLADLVLLFSAANVTNLDGTRWMAKALAQPRLIEARGGRPLQLMPIPSRIEQTSQKEELVDFRARFVQALREYVPQTLGSADAFALEAEIPYMPFYSFNERVVAREPAARREQKLYAAYANIADAIVRIGAANGLLDVRGGAAEPQRVRTRVARVEPPKEPVVLTYEESDRETAEHLAAALQAAGVKVVARFQSAGTHWAAQFDSLLATCEGMIVLAGAGGLTPLTSGDLAAARRRETVNARFRSIVISTSAAPARLFETGSGPTLAYPSNGTPTDEFIQDAVAMLTSSATRGWDETISPYIGMRPFAEEDARFFFGRDPAMNELNTLVGRSGGRGPRWIQIEGFAGVGKSSLARAGLVPAIRRGLLTGSAHPIRLAIFRPAADPVASLCSALTPPDMQDERSRRQILDEFRRDEGTVARLVRWGDHPAPVVLLLDQLEQLCTADPDAVDRVGRVLTAAMADESLPLYVISTVRTEQLAAVENLPLFSRLRPAVRYTLDPLDDKDVADVVGKPAAVAGITFEPGLLDRIVMSATAFRTAPGMISFLMQALWNRRVGRTITHEAYGRGEGGFAGILMKHANRVLEGYAGKPEHDQLRRLMLGLTTSSGTRASLTHQEALYAAAGSIPAEHILEIATGASLVAPSQGRVSLVHDTLLEPGSVIRSWYEVELTTLKVRDELEAAANAWEASGRPDSGLPSGALLERLAGAGTPSVRATEFLTAARSFQARLAEEVDALAIERKSRAEDVERDVGLRKQREAEQRMAQKRAARMARLSQAAVFVLLIATAGAIYWATSARRDATVAQADAEATQAVALVNDRPDRALTLAVSAADRAQTENTLSALKVALAASRARTRFAHAGDILRTTFDGKGQRVLTIGRDGRANVWEVSAPDKPVWTSEGATSEYLDGDLAQDGQHVVIATRDGAARVWTVGDRRDPIVLRSGRAPIGFARFSQDGSAVITSASREPAARTASLARDLILLTAYAPIEIAGPVNLWDARSGQLRQSFATKRVPEAVALSSDGRLLVTAAGSDATLWDAAGGAMVREMNAPVPAEGFSALSFSGDASRILCAVGSTVILWDRRPSWGLTQIAARSRINAATFDSSAGRVVVGNTDGSAEIVTLAAEPAKRPLIGHSGPVLGVAFSPDGSRVATASQDGTVRLWDAKAERDPVVLKGHEGAVTSVAFSPDGKQLLTKADDNSARLWDVAPASAFDALPFPQLLEEARRRAPRQ